MGKIICYFHYNVHGKGPFSAVPDLGHMRPCASLVMRSLNWALKEVDPVQDSVGRVGALGNI
jgi:hypothetical protein